MTLTKGDITDVIVHIHVILNELTKYRFYTLMEHRVSQIEFYKKYRNAIKPLYPLTNPKYFSLSSTANMEMHHSLKACIVWESLLNALSDIEKELSRFPKMKDSTTIFIIPHASTIEGCINEDGIPILTLTTLAEKKLTRIMNYKTDNNWLERMIIEDL